jgi:3-oxoacyl-[acyl-carrier protein] reductase
MELGLAGATACITGGTRGMGRATAERLALEEARVAVIGRDRDALDETLDALRACGGPDPVALAADITDPAAVTTAFEALETRWGSLNVLVNAAGPATQRVRWSEIPDDDWTGAFTLGTLGPIRCMRAALPLLRAASWARIVNIGAMSTRVPGPHRAAYTASKAALAQVTKQVSIDLAPEQILVNTVSPGAVFTDQLRDKLSREDASVSVDVTDDTALMDWLSRRSGFASQTGRVGRPEQVADLIAFLVSPRNAYVTGADVNIDGGSAFR